jgi:hypothetical protein
VKPFLAGVFIALVIFALLGLGAILLLDAGMDAMAEI